MIKRYLIIIMILSVNAVSYLTCAQNTLVYFRYDIVPDNIGRIIDVIDSVKNSAEGRFVLYYENQGYENNKYDELVSSKDFLRYISIYEPENEEIFFSQFSSTLLEEKVAETTISGTKDKEWKYIFILSDVSQKQELIRLMSVNSWQKRLNKVQFIIYDEKSSVHKEPFRQFVENNNIMVLDY